MATAVQGGVEVQQNHPNAVQLPSQQLQNTQLKVSRVVDAATQTSPADEAEAKEQVRDVGSIDWSDNKVKLRAFLIAVIIAGLITAAVFAGIKAHSLMEDKPWRLISDPAELTIAGVNVGFAIGMVSAAVYSGVTAYKNRYKVLQNNSSLAVHLLKTCGATLFGFLAGSATGGSITGALVAGGITVIVGVGIRSGCPEACSDLEEAIR